MPPEHLLELFVWHTPNIVSTPSSLVIFCPNPIIILSIIYCSPNTVGHNEIDDELFVREFQIFKYHVLYL